jgi:hypothetical protein
MREIEASTVARCDGSRWSVASTVARRRSCCGRELRPAVVLHVRKCNRAPKRVCEERRKTRKLEEEERRGKETGAHQNRRRDPSVSAGLRRAISAAWRHGLLWNEGGKEEEVGGFYRRGLEGPLVRAVNGIGE